VSEPQFVLREVWRYGDRDFDTRDEAHEFAMKLGVQFPAIGYGYKWRPVDSPDTDVVIINPLA
jgi:hypothetical protein